MDEFLADVDAVYTKLGRCQIAVNEGIRDADGKEIGPQLMGTGEVDAHGNVQLSGSGVLWPARPCASSKWVWTPCRRRPDRRRSA